MRVKEWMAERYSEKGFFAWLAFVLELIAVAVLFFLMLLTCVDVIGRYLFSNSINGAVELSRISLAILIFTVIPVITWRGGHVIVDLLDHILGKTAVKYLSLASALLIPISLYVVGDRMFELAARSLRRGVVTEYLEFPEGYLIYYIALMSWITAAVMITYGVYRIFAKKG
jgi:TRAP-type C4-dicarboxylate transport system permease small subunit